jgi:hypothetical protein
LAWLDFVFVVLGGIDQIDGFDDDDYFVCFYLQLVALIFLSISLIMDLKVRTWFRVRVRELELGFSV